MALSRFSAYFSVLIISFYSVYCEKDTLVLLDNLAIRETHSIFFKALKG